MGRKSGIVIISPEAWGASFVSKHHYADNLARMGYPVMFVNPPRSVIGSSSVEVTGISENLSQCTYTVQKGLNYLPPFLKKWYLTRIATKMIKTWSHEPGLVWSFDPYQFQDPTVFGSSVRSIYHAVDIHQTALEAQCTRNFQEIFGSSGPIVQKLKNLGAVNAEKVNHGLAAWFCEPVEQPIPLPRTYDISVGYVGNMLYPYLDYEVLYEIVQSHPKVGFFFIGPDGTSNLGTTAEGLAEKHLWITRIKEEANTHFLGVQPSRELPRYLAAFDAFLMTYKGEEYPDELANPHKILEYLSTGKVVISHFIDEYRDKEPFVEMATRKELPARFAVVLAGLADYNTPELRDQRKSYATSNAYDQHVAHILGKINYIGGHREDEPSTSPPVVQDP